MSETRKTSRRNAGKHQSIDPDFLWPSNFGRGLAMSCDNNRVPPSRENIPVDESLNVLSRKVTSCLEVNSANGSILSSKVSNHDKTSKVPSKTMSRKSSKMSSHKSKLIEKAQTELAIEKSKLKILQIQQLINEAETESDSLIESEQDRNTYFVEDNIKATRKWVEDLPDKFSNNGSNKPYKNALPEENSEPSKPTDDMRNICSTFVEAMKHFSNSPAPNKFYFEKDNLYFDGRAQDWPLFIEHFNRQVKVCKYNDEEKILKLRRCLKGEALESVKSMMLHPKNTDLILKTLEMRFGRTEFVVESLINGIRLSPKVREPDMEALIKYSCKCNNLVATLEHLDSKHHLENPQLQRELLAKLPDNYKMNWGQEVMKHKGKVNVKHFTEWLNTLASAACYISVPAVNSSGQHQCNKNWKGTFQRNNESVMTTTETKIEYCVYCKTRGHKIPLCPKIREDSIDERISKITKLGTCFRCLNGKHMIKDCKSKRHCKVSGCGRRHHELLHKEAVSTRNDKENEEIVPGSLDIQQFQEMQSRSIPSTSTESTFYSAGEPKTDSKVLLRIAPVKLYGPDGILQTFALFDEASTVTLIEDEVASQLGLQGSPEPFCMRWAKNIVTNNEESRSVNIEISGDYDEAKVYQMKNVRTISKLSLPSQSINMSEYNNFPHIKGLPLRDMKNARATILIGQDNIRLTVARKVFQGPEDSPLATKTNLGWILHGKTTRGVSAYTFFTCTSCILQEDQYTQLDKLIRDNFSTESFGTTCKNYNNSKEDKRAIEILEKTTRRINTENRYETGLLWKHDFTKLSESRNTAISRLLCVERKLARNEEYKKEYCNKIQEYLDKGYIRKLSCKEAAIEDGKVWYLPHFGVKTTNKPKLRLVFDAAAKSHGVSLNDHLLQGPDFLQSLPGVLMRFRRRTWGICGDIREMFHQVKIIKEDRSAQRFFWRNGNPKVPIETYEMQVMTFGATCSPCSAQYVKNLNSKQSQRYPELARDVERNFYVDDYLDSVDTEEESIQKVKKIIELNLEGGFHVVNWISNSQKVMKCFNEKKNITKELNKSTYDRVLGVWWDTDNDVFTFKTNFNKIPQKLIDGSIIPTKKEVLKLVMSLFDPLGFLTCISIRGRILMQQVWRSGISWDEKVSTKIYEPWKIWLEVLKTITRIKIPRCYIRKLGTPTKLEVHIFCDASEDAFAAVAYLRAIKGNEFEVSLLCARAKVAPLKPLSIPRLELQAAVMASRLVYTIQHELDLVISKYVLWSDSKTVLWWIRGDGRNYKQYVAHRIGEIQELTKNANWRYIPTNLNIADWATRVKFEDLNFFDPESTWFIGPKILHEPDEFFKDIANTEFSLIDDMEKKESCFVILEEKLSTIAPDVRRFSKWRRMVRCTAYIQRFCNKMLLKIGRSIENISSETELSLEEIESAELTIIKKAQEDSFSEDILSLKTKNRLSRNSKIFKLNPYLDKNGLLRLKGRLHLASYLDEKTRNPYILDNKSAYAKLLVQYYHEQFRHQGIETVLNELRQKYWITKGRSLVKLVFNNCMFCRKRKAKPEVPLMGDLPEIRLTPGEPPFTYTGVDYFGPLHVTVGRHKEKRYGVLFTCLTTRAIHLEVAHDLTTDSAIMAIRRFSCRRGHQKVFYSDNGTNLKGANEEIRKCIKEFDQSRILNEMAGKGTEWKWKFLPPGAPHMGGCWERLIGSVKKVLSVILTEEAPKDESLLTFFAEAEMIVNNRPLTHVSSDPSDFESLTPNHFLIGRYSPSLFPGKFDDRYARKQWRNVQRLTDIFWSRWIKEYLPTLSRRARWINDCKPVKEGEMVIMIEPNAPRNSWPLGIIQHVFPGKDGRIRVVEVKTRDGTYRRPVTKICRFQEESEN